MSRKRWNRHRSRHILPRRVKIQEAGIPDGRAYVKDRQVRMPNAKRIRDSVRDNAMKRLKIVQVFDDLGASVVSETQTHTYLLQNLSQHNLVSTSIANQVDVVCPTVALDEKARSARSLRSRSTIQRLTGGPSNSIPFRLDNPTEIVVD